MRQLRHLFSRGGLAVLILLFAGLAAACHSNAIAVVVSISPNTTSLALQGTTTFFATVTGATDTTVIWQVNGVTGGNSTCGTITTNGLYTAPNALPAATACAGATSSTTACNSTVNGTITATSGCVLITAISNQDNKTMGFASVTLVSGVTITVAPSTSATMATSENLKFVATVSGATNLSVNWFVDGVQGGTMATGFITPTTIGNGSQANAAVYSSPATVPSPNTVTIEAQAAADTTQKQNITVTISLATPPILDAIAPVMIPQGAILEDVYLTGSNFLSTTTVQFSGVDLTTVAGGSVTAIDSSVIRARVPAILLANAGPFTVTAQEQNPMPGQPVQSLQGQIVPVRPSLLGATPSGLTQNSPTTSIELSGGYFTASTISEWNGHLVSTTDDAGFPRSVQATINQTDLTEAGLFPIAVRTPAATPQRSALNVSIRPPGGPAAANTTISGFMKPVAVAFNDLAGTAVVVDQGLNQVDVLNGGLTGIASMIAVGTTPTSIGIDGARNLALVTDVGSNDVAVVDLSALALNTTLPCLGMAPVAVGVDEIHGRALVVNQNGSAATILDTTHPMTCPVTQAISMISRTGGVVTATLANALTIPGGNGSGVVTISGVMDATYDGTFVVTSGSGTTTLTWSQAGADGSSSGGSAATGSVLGTVPVSTGTQPQIAVIPEMGWAVVTPGGAGTLSVVDLTRLSLVFSASITATTKGVAVNAETKSVLLADPSSSSGLLFSLHDESISSVALTLGNVAAAANPFTNVGVLLNPASHQAYMVDLNIPTQITSFTLGSDPIAIALDPATNMALVADDVDRTVTVVDLGATRSRNSEPQILQMSPILAKASATAVPLTITGAGFTGASQIRLNETAIPTTFVSSRQLTASIPPSFLTQPLRIVVDVQNSASLFSNVKNLLVALPVPVGTSPQGVAVDQDNDRALVANSGDGTVSVIDISPASPTFGTVISTLTVGSTPLGVGIVSRSGLAVVTNGGASTASIMDLTTNPFTVPSTVSLGSDPTGVGISESLGAAIITNTNSNSLSQFVLSNSGAPSPSGVGVDNGPIAAATAPDLNYAVVANAGANTAEIFNIVNGSPAFLNRVSNISAASSVDYDPVNQLFLVESSGSNTIVLVNPVTLLESSIRTGVDPTSMSFNVQDGALLTLNAGSGTLSILDLPAQKVRDVLPFTAGTLYAMGIHRRLEYVIVSDPTNNQVLVLPLPR